MELIKVSYYLFVALVQILHRTQFQILQKSTFSAVDYWVVTGTFFRDVFSGKSPSRNPRLSKRYSSSDGKHWHPTIGCQPLKLALLIAKIKHGSHQLTRTVWSVFSRWKLLLKLSSSWISQNSGNLSVYEMETKTYLIEILDARKDRIVNVVSTSQLAFLFWSWKQRVESRKRGWTASCVTTSWGLSDTLEGSFLRASFFFTVFRFHSFLQTLFCFILVQNGDGKFSKGSHWTPQTPQRNTGLLLRPKYKIWNIHIFYIYFRFLWTVDINDFHSDSIMRTNCSSILTRTKVSNNCIKGFGKVRARICVLQRQQFSNGEPEGWW